MRDKLVLIREILTNKDNYESVGSSVDGYPSFLIRDDLVAQQINALYSEPQVVCPKAGECIMVNSCKPVHSEPHIKNDLCDLVGNHCPACIPIPSTPASEGYDEHEHADGTIHSHRQGAYAHIHKVGQPLPPDELLTDEEIIHNALEEMHTEKEGYLLIAKAIRADEKAKCHQSESAKIKALEARIDFQKSLRDEIYLYMNQIAIPRAESEARADQNKKIGKALELEKWVDLLEYKFLSTETIKSKELIEFREAIAKLQKGDF